MLDEVVVYFDGGARGNPGPAAIGAVVFDPSSAPPARLAAVSERIGETTNNVAEYRALIAGLEAAAAGRWKVKQPHLRPLVDRVRELLAGYENVDLGHVRREFNTDADALVNAALDLP